MACFVIIHFVYCDCNHSVRCNPLLQGWNDFLAYCAALLAIDIIIVSIKLSPNLWEMLSLPAAVAMVNILIGLLGGQRESLKGAIEAAVAVPLIHANCIERVVTYVKMAHICEVRTYWWKRQKMPSFFFLISNYVLCINSTLVNVAGEENTTW